MTSTPPPDNHASACFTPRRFLAADSRSPNGSTKMQCSCSSGIPASSWSRPLCPDAPDSKAPQGLRRRADQRDDWRLRPQAQSQERAPSQKSRPYIRYVTRSVHFPKSSDSPVVAPDDAARELVPAASIGARNAGKEKDQDSEPATRVAQARAGQGLAYPMTSGTCLQPDDMSVKSL